MSEAKVKPLQQSQLARLAWPRIVEVLQFLAYMGASSAQVAGQLNPSYKVH